MADGNLQQKTLSSLIWKFFERFGAQIIQFVVGIILARLLLPEDYGSIALLTVFIAVANVFTQSGFSTALIRKLDADDLDYSSVFYCSLFISIIIYIILFFTAPYIANFYEMPILKDVLRVLSLSVIISTYNSMQNTILQKQLLFKRLFISSFSAVIISGGIGIAFAYLGYGIWALVAQQLSSTIITTFIMLFTVKWHPKLMFSFARLKTLFGFGWKLLLSGILNTIYENLYSLIIGKKYTPDDLAYWNRGKQFPDLIVNNINGSINSVMYPVYSLKQNNLADLKSTVRRAMKTSSFVVFPMMVGLAVCAEPLVRLLLTDKWLFCVPFLQAWCIVYAFMPLHTTNLNVYNALGRSDIFLWLEIIKKIIGIITLFATLPFGLGWMMFGKILTSILGIFINALPNTKILKYSMKEQLVDILPSMLVALAMGGIVYCISLIPMHYVAILVVQILVGIILYVLLSRLFKLEPYLYCKQILIKAFRKIKNKITTKRQGEKMNENNTVITTDNSQNIDNIITQQKKKILLLGGTVYLVPVIETIHKLGYEAITCDYLPDNVAHKYADAYYNVSIVDEDAVLKLAKELKIDGIMSFATDPGVKTASYVQEQLGLPSQGPYESVKILQNKSLFRQFLKDNGFNCPIAFSFTRLDEALNSANSFPYPVIVKPVDSAGSKGVSRVNNVDEFEKAAKYAFNSSINNEIIVEQFLEKDGHSSDSDCFSVDGKLVYTSFSSQYFDKQAENEYVPSAYAWPSQMDNADQEDLRGELQRLITLLNMKTSLYNVETRKATDGKTYIMEVSPRGGGNRLSEMIKLWSNVDLIEMAVKGAVGEEITLPESKPNGYLSEIILHSDKAGTFEKIEVDDTIKANVVETNLIIKQGDEVEQFSGANKMIGTIVLKFNSRNEQLAFMNDINNLIKIIVK